MSKEKVESLLSAAAQAAHEAGGATALFVVAIPDHEEKAVDVMATGSGFIGCEKDGEASLPDMVHRLQMLHEVDPDIAHKIVEATHGLVTSLLDGYVEEQELKEGMH